MRLAISRSTNSNSTTSGTAGNQKREAVGVSGTTYDMSYMAKCSDSADQGLGDKQCSLSMANNVARTSNNIDERTAAEKMFATGNSSNFKFSVYFTSASADKAIEANLHLERRVKYELDKLRDMELSRYRESEEDMIKMAAVRNAKRILANQGYPGITQGEWERAINLAGCKAKQYGINTIELAVRASTRDVSLKTGNANAWGVTDQGYEAATYNAAGTKTLPLFTEAQVTKAKEISENLYVEFKEMYEYALSAPADYDGIFERFCKVCSTIDKDVPGNWECKYQIWNDAQKDRIDSLAQRLADMIIGG